jgi:eukaryotic-like serine/threonine-protein kinase
MADLQTLGKYQIVEEIGRGGFATVYLARDEEAARDVALKILDPQLARDPLVVQRFQHEFQLAQRLDHPHIVKALDFGEVDSRLYLAMALVRGFDLRVRLKKSGPLAVDAALNIARQIAGALDYAHQQGILHRDIKSANVLLDADGRALLSDFGLMQAVDGSTFMTTYTTSSGFLGTAEYLSPEQANGQSATARSDFYSFGIVVYEMLTGQVPFKADQPVAVLHQHATAAPPNPLSLRPDLPPALAAEVLRALAKRPADRPASATKWVVELAQAVEADQQAGAETRRRLLQRRESAVAQARAKIEALQQQQAAAERARRQAEAQAKQLEAIAAETEAVLKDLQEQEAAAQQAVQAAEQARRTAEDLAAAAQTRVEQVENALRRYEGLPEATPRTITLTLAKGVDMIFVRVSAGEFMMGAADTDRAAHLSEKPQHKVYLDKYLIGASLVTVAQFAAFVNATKYQCKTVLDVKAKANHPVTNVNWQDAAAFCDWVTKQTGQKVRLPTEAEWEKAARGPLTGSGDARLYPWGDDAPTADHCNFGNTVKDTTPVGRYSPKGDSPYGCTDMAGNVWEWCADWFDENYYAKTPTKNPTGPANGQLRVLRGGSWGDRAIYARASSRGGLASDNVYGHVGFRCAH